MRPGCPLAPWVSPALRVLSTLLRFQRPPRALSLRWHRAASPRITMTCSCEDSVPCLHRSREPATLGDTSIYSSVLLNGHGLHCKTRLVQEKCLPHPQIRIASLRVSDSEGEDERLLRGDATAPRDPGAGAARLASGLLGLSAKSPVNTRGLGV